MESFSAENNSSDLHFQSPIDSQPPMILSIVILSLTFLLGLPGNGLVLWIAGLKMRRTVNTIWFLNLTLADFLCCLSLPFSLAHLVLQGHWPYGWLLCKIIPSVILLNMFASVFLLTAISLDRCLLVRKPIWCQNHRNVKTAFIICACIWISAFVMCMPVFIYRSTFPMNNHSVCSYDFGDYDSSDYSDFPFHLLSNDSGNSDPMAQQLGEIHQELELVSLQTHDPPWTTALADGPSPTFQRPSGGPGPLKTAQSSGQPPAPNSFQPAVRVLPPAVPSDFSRDHHRRDSLDAFPSPDLPPSHAEDSELWDYMQGDYMGHYASTPQVAITFSRLIVGFLLPSSVMMVCYSLIVLRMRQGRFHKSSSKTLRVTVVVVVVFLVCWAPYHIMGVLSLYTDPDSALGEALSFWDPVSIALASANSCFNPFLYALLGKDFRKHARQSMQGILEAAFSEEPTHTTNSAPNKSISEGNNTNTAV